MRIITKVLVTGSDGVVGSYVPMVFSEKKYKLLLTNRITLDVTQKKQVAYVFKSFRPDIVLHLAAKTDVDACEKNPEDTLSVNVYGTRTIATACREHNAILLYMSTAAVFNGKKKGFSERDTPMPLSIYGKSKYEAEREVCKIVEKFYIIRTGWVIGGGKKEKKFISYILNKLKNGDRIHVVNDTFGTIAYAKDLVAFFEMLYRKKFPYGTYHFGSKGVCSRYDVAEYIQNVVQSNAEIISVPSTRFSEQFFAPRPKYEILKSKKVPFLTHWKESLSAYIRNELV